MEEKVKFGDVLLWKSETNIMKKLSEKTEITFQDENHTVTDITVCGSEIQSIQEEIIALPNLKSIDFVHEDVREVPSWLTECKSLKTLYFSNKKPQSYSVISELIQLESLFLSDSYLTDLPMILETLGNLKQLDLSFNSLKTVPKVIQNYPKLEHLFLGHNRLTELPDWLPEKNSNLTYLALNVNGLRPFPKQILKIEKLQKLEFASNNIREIPSDINTLINLESLNLEENRLTTLPDSISQLKNLKSLYLKNNPIEEDEMEQLLIPLRKNGCHIYFI